MSSQKAMTFVATACDVRPYSDVQNTCHPDAGRISPHYCVRMRKLCVFGSRIFANSYAERCFCAPWRQSAPANKVAVGSRTNAHGTTACRGDRLRRPRYQPAHHGPRTRVHLLKGTRTMLPFPLPRTPRSMFPAVACGVGRRLLPTDGILPAIRFWIRDDVARSGEERAW